MRGCLYVAESDLSEVTPDSEANGSLDLSSSSTPVEVLHPSALPAQITPDWEGDDFSFPAPDNEPLGPISVTALQNVRPSEAEIPDSLMDGQVKNISPVSEDVESKFGSASQVGSRHGYLFFFFFSSSLEIELFLRI